MARFYSSAFGWKTKMLGKDTGNGKPKKTGIINGGFYAKNNDKPAQYPSVVIAVESIKKSMNKVTKAGGKVIGEPMDIPGFGKYVSFYDSEGNRVSIMEPTMEMKQNEKGK